MVQAKSEIELHLGILERELTGKQYLVAGQFTLAEVCYIPFLQFLSLMEITPTPEVARWVKQLQTLPSVIQTTPAG